MRDKIAGIYFYRLKYSETGFEVLNKSLKIYRKIGEPEEVAKTLSRIGYFYLYTAKNELKNPLESQRKALDFYSQAILFYREINDFSKFPESE
ncbi:MAG: hypothetical protein F6K13_02185 [Okeania sp. SIO2B9]|nr:hypothetical protein [Okeania sp. SIO2B9]